jgi:uncharacterized protein YbjT (DUF2867 family)
MYVVTGATGHTGNTVAKTLLNKGQKVRAVSRTQTHLKALSAEGAEPFSADITDAAAVTKAFEGAKAVYLLIPPNPSAADVTAFQNRVADAVARGVRNARVPYAVLLSSIGADKPDKTGPVLGLRYFEQQLNRIEGLNVLHLRAGYFMENTLAQIGMIRSMGMAAGPLRPDLRVPMIATHDIGEAAARALLSLDFQKQQTRELHGQRDLTMNEVVQIIGRGIGKPDLRYIQAPNEQVKAGMIQFGLSGNMADLLLEMTSAMNSGYMRPLEPRSENNTTPTPFEDFVRQEFVPQYQGKAVAA